MTIGSLFSGIGGLDLGLEHAGLGPVIFQAETDAYCRAVLAKHWPNARRYCDVREIDEACERPDVLCGGFPCQDISPAGSRLGLAGQRSGLWSEYARIVRALRPRIVVVENSADILARGLGTVLGDLAALGYDAIWDCVPAAAVGAPFRRDRAFVIAGREPRGLAVADADCWRRQIERVANDRGLEGTHGGEPDRRAPHRGVHRAAGSGQWSSEPDVARVAYGAPVGLDRRRLTAQGNAVVPQVAEVIGRVVVEILEAA